MDYVSFCKIHRSIIDTLCQGSITSERLVILTGYMPVWIADQNEMLRSLREAPLPLIRDVFEVQLRSLEAVQSYLQGDGKVPWTFLAGARRLIVDTIVHLKNSYGLILAVRELVEIMKDPNKSNILERFRLALGNTIKLMVENVDPIISQSILTAFKEELAQVIKEDFGDLCISDRASYDGIMSTLSAQNN